MSKLHLISQALELKQLKACLSRYATKEDPLLFIGDSVTTLLDNEVIDFINLHSYKVSVLDADCACRGINQMMSCSIRQISDQEMVELTLKHQQTISW